MKSQYNGLESHDYEIQGDKYEMKSQNYDRKVKIIDW